MESTRKTDATGDVWCQWRENDWRDKNGRDKVMIQLCLNVHRVWYISMESKKVPLVHVDAASFCAANGALMDRIAKNDKSKATAKKKHSHFLTLIEYGWRGGHLTSALDKSSNPNLISCMNVKVTQRHSSLFSRSCLGVDTNRSMSDIYTPLWLKYNSPTLTPIRWIRSWVSKCADIKYVAYR